MTKGSLQSNIFTNEELKKHKSVGMFGIGKFGSARFGKVENAFDKESLQSNTQTKEDLPSKIS